MGVREAVEQAIFVAVGAASLTRERAEAIVGDLVHREQLGEDEGRLTVDRLMERVRVETDGIRGRIDSGVQGAMRELGVAHRDDVSDLDLRMSELEHRIRLLEGAAGTAPGSAGGDEPLA